jgi:hypothetical protein
LFRWDSGITSSLVLRLLGHLPEGGAYWAAVAESTPDTGDRTKKVGWRGWTFDRILLADIRDGIAGGNWQRGGGTGRRPDPAPRPAIRKMTGRDRMRMAANAKRRRPKA